MDEDIFYLLWFQTIAQTAFVLGIFTVTAGTVHHWLALHRNRAPVI